MADPKPLAPTTWAELAQGYAMLAREVREDVRRIDGRLDAMQAQLGEVHTVVSEKVEKAIRAHDNEVDAATLRSLKKNVWRVVVGVLVVALAGSGYVGACVHYRSASLPAAAP